MVCSRIRTQSEYDALKRRLEGWRNEVAIERRKYLERGWTVDEVNKALYQNELICTTMEQDLKDFEESNPKLRRDH